MKITHFIPVAVAALAFVVGPGSAAQSQSSLQQCYHTILDPPDACSICKNTCAGAGYVCCSIIVVKVP